MKEIIQKISRSIVEMDEEMVGALVMAALEDPDLTAREIYEQGLNEGMVQAIRLHEDKVYDIPEIIVCADTLNKGLKVLQEQGNFNSGEKPKVLLTVVAGDTHEIGKNIVKIMMEAGGYEVIDLGVNQSAEHIIEMALEKRVSVIGLSSMMSTTREEMREVIKKLDAMDLEDRPFIIVGGGSITENFAKEINSDGYSANAPKAVKLVDSLLGREN